MDNILDVSLKIVLAILVGGLVGWERASKRHSAGLRTFMVVTLSTDIVMMLELYLHDKFGASIYILSAAAIIAVSSVAVNSIFFSAKNQIKGLTTSATLWACGVIGLIIGAGYYLVAALALAGLYLTISVMPTLEEYLKNRCNHFEVQAELNSATSLPSFVDTLNWPVTSVPAASRTTAVPLIALVSPPSGVISVLEGSLVARPSTV